MPEPSAYTIITGASEGLGKSLALECAGRNWNLLLVDLPGSRVKNLCAFIKNNYDVEAEAFEHDLTLEKECFSFKEEIESRKLPVNRLINNAGIGGTVPFDEGQARYFEKEILLNTLAATLLTRLFLENLEKNAPAHILNIGSLAAFFELPQKQVYAASKAFLYSFSRSLRHELAPKSISVSIVCPGGINTNIPVTLLNKSGNWLRRTSIMEPEDVARIAIREMLLGKPLIIPGLLNRIFLQLSRLLPPALRQHIVNGQMNGLRSQDRLGEYLKLNGKNVQPILTS